MNALQLAVADGLTITRRNVIKIRRTPDMLGAVVLLPIVFVLMFAYVFGSVIDIPGMSYREFMIPGVFAQTVVLSGQLTGYTLTLDLQKGIIDRFRTLPMSSSAVLVGQTTGDLLMNLSSVVVMALVGLLVGWRVHTSPLEVVGGFLVLVLFAYAFSWVTATVALALRTPEIFNNIATLVSFPLSFIANTFIDSTRLPGPLKAFADWNPVSAVTLAARQLFGNTNPAMPVSGAWPMQHPIATSLLWSVLILIIFVPLATRLFQKAVSR
ncbi:ABC transporter permease [Nonomuraea sediminis]|uniref:ABC transporter permease n=1 Tax=Nonomuraea sediminis TaxID=2835864 RepID=UPI001BDD9A0F|nr:ABC transporter permease [Nonomuraea sediminis]